MSASVRDWILRFAVDEQHTKVVAGVPDGDEARAAIPIAAEDVGAHPRCRASRSFGRLTQTAPRLLRVWR